MKFETAFSKAWGRPPTRAEVERVERVCDAFEVRDNDALKAVAGLLEFYDGRFRGYPGQCAEAATNGVQRWLGSAEGAAVLSSVLRAPDSFEGLHCTRFAATGSQEVSKDSRELHAVILGGLATAASAVSGALGMVVGSALSGYTPCWVPRDATSSVVANVVGAPMGWLLVLGLLVPAQYAASWGWKRGRDGTLPAAKRSLGWVAVAAVSGSMLGCGALLYQLALKHLAG